MPVPMVHGTYSIYCHYFMKTCLLHDNTCGQLQTTVKDKELGLGTNLLVTGLFIIMSPTDAGVQGGGRRERSSRCGYSRPPPVK